MPMYAICSACIAPPRDPRDRKALATSLCSDAGHASHPILCHLHFLLNPFKLLAPFDKPSPPGPRAKIFFRPGLLLWRYRSSKALGGLEAPPVCIIDQREHHRASCEAASCDSETLIRSQGYRYSRLKVIIAYMTIWATIYSI